jgi:hypothetical protein
LQMSGRKYLAGVAVAVSMITASSAAQRTVLKSLTACPYVKDFTDWFEAMEKGGCIEVNKGDLVVFDPCG